jgi:dienelactone hydrolase
VPRQVPEEKLFSTGPQPQLTAFLYSPKTPPATGAAGPPVIFYSGDWGWVPMQQDAASYLASTGRFVLGIDSPQYFKSLAPREDLEADLAKFRSFVNERAGRPKEAGVILAGFAAGADVIPYLLNQTGAAGIRGAVLIAPDGKGVKVMNISARLNMERPPEEQIDVGSELRRMAPLPVVFMDGALDTKSAAKVLSGLPRGPHKYARVVGGDHQFHDVRDTFFSLFAEALRWIDDTASATAPPPGATSPAAPSPAATPVTPPGR